MRDELKHTFWFFHRVESVKAIAKLLKSHPVFKDYEIVIAADQETYDESAYKKVLIKLNGRLKITTKPLR